MTNINKIIVSHGGHAKVLDILENFTGSGVELELYEALVDEMPYGVAKARTGDPIEWLYNKVNEEVNIMSEKSLQKAREARVGVKAELNPIVKSKKFPQSRKLAINAFCANCMGCTEDHLEKGFREEIKNCTAPKCPLYRFRPYQ